MYRNVLRDTYSPVTVRTVLKLDYYLYISASQSVGRDPSLCREAILSGSRKDFMHLVTDRRNKNVTFVNVITCSKYMSAALSAVPSGYGNETDR